MKPGPKIEREFGVPFAGEILEQARWVRTALKRLPAEGPIDWSGIFGRTAPLVVDLGCGNGRFLLSSAVQHPQFDHVGIDILPVVLRYATRRANQRGLSNIRFAAIDAQTFLGKYIAPASVREFHCYHPQPYHDYRLVERRLITPAFLVLARQCLEPEGLLFLQTDNQPYWQYLRRVVPAFFEFQEQTRPWPGAPRGRTRREIMGLRRGLPIYRGWGRAKHLTMEECQVLAATLPLPLFDAGPPLPGLDERL